MGRESEIDRWIYGWIDGWIDEWICIDYTIRETMSGLVVHNIYNLASLRLQPLLPLTAEHTYHIVRMMVYCLDALLLWTNILRKCVSLCVENEKNGQHPTILNIIT